ncbi:hypothetical protein ANN_01162 [Periplaneta americana]|uniref:Uncharacterized protein n=1 Tax=Periplaneta americana TaxID=6978 RepID=A0ABQ8TST2_PERAM|nr:hypothetical protein ANN_01162 [Periplaneta americana]
MSPGSSTESYPAFDHIGLREKPRKKPQPDGPFRRYLSSSSVSLEPLLILALRCAVVDGQTGRSFHTRYNEHIKAITKPYITSNYADHIIDNNHDYNNIETDMEILHITPKSSQLNILEQYEIYKNTIAHPQYILNTQLQFNTHTLFDVIVRHIIQTTNPTIGATHPHPYHRQLHIAEPKSAVVQETLKTTTNSVETGRLSKNNLRHAIRNKSTELLDNAIILHDNEQPTRQPLFRPVYGTGDGKY